MIDNLIKKIVGSKNDRELKRLWKNVQVVNQFEPILQSLSDQDLRAKTPYFKELLRQGKTLDEILPEAFAVVREASRRVLRMRHFDVQLIGGMVLHEGKISEMRTGEGKTLTATLPLYLNALAGKGAHLVTVNDYLARRDADWMGRLYTWLGLTVGVIQHGLSDDERREAYAKDITYATNNEIGFDYLRDNMKWDLADFCQRGFHFAIVDEVDSILIDEARTPLIIAGSSEEDTSKYYKIDAIIPKLSRDTDFKIEEKDRQVVLTDAGIRRAEELLKVGNLYDPTNIEHLHGLSQALLAHHMYFRDKEYMVSNKTEGKGKEVVIVDEFTGRLMPGRRWSNGLHQAIEAKEGVEVNAENQTLATVTFQNFFRMYKRLSGMTGTAETEAKEFYQIYNLEVVVIPTNQPMIRKDYSDMVFATAGSKIKAIVAEVQKLNEMGQPILIGTASIESSEMLSKELKKAGIKHVVLNAKHHEKEADIIAQAGRKNAVTIATNMAGRGTDILLGGNPEALAKREHLQSGINIYDQDNQETPEYRQTLARLQVETEKEKQEVIAIGGLHILGTERHESRRIDNQLRGRAGRQGDPGSSRFFLSLEDDLMRIFGGERIKTLMSAFGLNDDEPIESRMVSSSIEKSQKRVETHHFEIRKHLLEYDDVMNKQRIFFYNLRNDVLKGNTKEYIHQITFEIIEGLHHQFCATAATRNLQHFSDRLTQLFGTPVIDLTTLPINSPQSVTLISQAMKEKYDQKERRFPSAEMLRWHEKVSIIQIIDAAWKRHLLVMDHLKEAIGFRGYGQKDPLVEYKRESFDYFQEMRYGFEDEIIAYLYRIEPQEEQPREELPKLTAPKRRTNELSSEQLQNEVKRILRFNAGGLDTEN
ncbi:MAG: preprotein translocase subunit SecA [Acidobacteriota bacterium]|jgi:preprotein translocase subunit SecA